MHLLLVDCFLLLRRHYDALIAVCSTCPRSLLTRNKPAKEPADGNSSTQEISHAQYINRTKITQNHKKYLLF